MFAKIKNLYRDFLISRDFVKSEVNSRREHILRTEQTYRPQVNKIEIELRKANSEIQTNLNNIYGEKLNEFEKGLTQLQHVIDDFNYRLQFFTRDYKSELELLYFDKQAFFDLKTSLYEKKQALKDQLDKEYANKRQAYDEMDNAQSSIDHWHRKSKTSSWLGGNKGKPIPKSSIFGQSMNDLSSYKNDKDYAYSNLQQVKDQIENIKDQLRSLNDEHNHANEEIDRIRDVINQTKKDRQMMFNLKTKGDSKAILKTKLDDSYLELARLHTTINHLKLERNKFENRERQRLGVVALERNLYEVNTQKNQYLSIFDKEENVAGRKMKHQEKWLRERNLKV